MKYGEGEGRVNFIIKMKKKNFLPKAVYNQGNGNSI